MAGNGRPPRGATSDSPAAVVAPEVPVWPLGEDVALKAKQMAAMESLAEINGDIEAEMAGGADGRKLGGLRRRQIAAKDRLATVDLQMQLAASLELEIWRELWLLPQAQAWRAQGWLRDVAQYARHKARGESGSLDDAKEARMWSDRLGLSPRAAAQMGLAFKVESPAAPAVPAAKGDDGNVTSIRSRRSRLTG